MESARPDYIHGDGNVVMHAPLQLRNANMYGFFVKGALERLQATVDANLNAVAAGRRHFKVLSPYVMLTFTRVGHAASTFPEDREKGWITEVDIITWVMVGQMQEQGGRQRLSRVHWYPCHVWVDDSMALINGRELFGYPKYRCDYEIPDLGADPRRCALAVDAFQTFDPARQSALAPLLDVQATGRSAADKPVASFAELVEEALTLLRSMPDFLDLDAAGWADVLSLLLEPRVDQLFLKQFPDSAGVKAVYQAILNAPARVDAVHGGSLLGYDYQCTVHPFASFPLDRTLGLALGAQPVLLPFNLYFDFTVTEGEVLVDNSQLAPEKIAILGGGVGAMTAAFHLTEQPGWASRYDITVYQMGWRLGGKGASGRNPAYGQRIEEHGLHIWFGFYENAFAMIRKAYDALERPPGAPLRTWQDAFKPHDFIALAEEVAGDWKTWPLDFPEKPGVPGDGEEALTLWQIATSVIAWIEKWLGELHAAHPAGEHLSGPVAAGQAHPDWLQRLAGEAGHAAHVVEAEAVRLGNDARALATAIGALAGGLSADVRTHDAGQHALLESALGGIKAWLDREFAELLDTSDLLRRLYICADLGLCVLGGMLRDGVFRDGFDTINHIDFMDWLRANGANEHYSVQSAPVRGFYDLVFAYVDGDFSQPNVEAGTLLRAMLRIGFCYKGGIMWKMQAGMGDTIFTPMYQVLKQRGVKFRFFHKVEELVADGDSVGEIRLTRQVDVTSGPDHYQPLVNVKGLACWPSGPDLAQIVPEQAALLREHDINLESHWSDWPAVYQARFGQPLPSLVLRRGQDFDRIVFGISIGAIPYLCPTLLAGSPALKQSVEAIKTVVTQAYQVWFDRDLATLGWTQQPRGQEPVLSGFSEPYDTWAPMDQLLCREDWPDGPGAPRNVSYFCSAMPVASFPPPDDHGFPARTADVAKAGAIAQLQTRIGALLPGVAEGGFQWSWLVDPVGGEGVARFDSQYWRANVDPSERYVLSVVDSTRHRLESDGSGYRNLYLAGDWIRTGLNAGCVEAATMAGMQASRAISGHPAVIRGERDF